MDRDWTPEPLNHSHWRGSKWTSSKCTSALFAASPPRTSQLSTDTFPSTNVTAHPTSARSAACATPPIGHSPATSSSSIAWRSRRASAGTAGGSRTTTRVSGRISWMWWTRMRTGHPAPSAKCVGRCLKRRGAWTPTWGHTGWRS